MINVMIADDNIEENSNCCKFLTKDKDIEVVSNTLNGITTVKEYFEKKPDVLLLDLELPDLNGLEVLDNISLDLNERKKCNIIIITGSDSLRMNLCNISKVYKIIPKPYNLEDIVTTIKEIANEPTELSRKEVKELLDELCFSRYSKGARYVADAIQLAYNDIDLLANVTELYKKVAIINAEKKNKIQRSIRSSIDVMNAHISKEQLRSFFHIYDSTVITPKYFFSIVIDYFRDKNEK